MAVHNLKKNRNNYENVTLTAIVKSEENSSFIISVDGELVFIR